ncbi:MAG: cyclopropane-fatty-acyl-phospholipid synthase family protein [Anaerolineae bacterium]
MVDEAAEITRSILSELFGSAPGVAARLWDGSRWPEDRPTRASLVLKHPGALRAMFLSGTELRLSEAYLYDDFDVEGDLEYAIAAAAGVPARLASWRDRLTLGRRLLRLPARPTVAAGEPQADRGRGSAQMHGRQHSLQRDRAAIAYHYDVSNDFYRLFLDECMVYSCAYFHTPDEDLDSAQRAKLDLLCRKLRLRPGQRLLDVGCGWGGLVMHAARHYGVDATGITLSQQQFALANQRIAEAGLGERARVLLQDYREVAPSSPYDALVSVGMFEHVGRALLPTYFEKALSLVRPGGVFLNHGIARGWAAQDASLQAGVAPRIRGRSFNDAYVFPDGELLPIGETLGVAERSGWEVRDVESLREHYALALRHWVRRLEAHHDQALQYVPEPTYRVWRLFMAGSAAGFTSGRLSVFQTLLSRPEGGAAKLPLTREDWYATAPLPAVTTEP